MITELKKSRLAHEESPVLTIQNFGWNCRVLDREDLRQFSRLYGLTVLCTPLVKSENLLCFDLRSCRLVLVDCKLSEPEVLYHAWYGCFGLLGYGQAEAHSIGLCATIPRSDLKFRTLKRRQVPIHLIGQRYWLAEQRGL